MSYMDNNPGRPFGSRQEDDDAFFIQPRLNPQGRQPWTDREPEILRPRASEKPRRVIPGAPGPDDDLPCVGRWDLFDTEEPTDEARQMCARCPFQSWCLEYSAANDEHWTWGGESRDERRAREREEVAA